METTAGSSAPHIPALAYLPVETQRWLFSRDAERVQALAEVQALKAASVERMAVAQAAAAAKWQAREDLVQQVIDDIGPQLQIEPRHNRVNKVLQRLTNKRGLLYQFKELPPRKVVKRVLKANGL